MRVQEMFDLTGRVVVITGGAGLLGRKHAEAVAEMGGRLVLLDIDDAVQRRAEEVGRSRDVDALGIVVDITQPESVDRALVSTLEAFGRVDALVNNAANNPKVEDGGLAGTHWSRLESFRLDAWNADIAVGLTGAFLCSQIFGQEMAQRDGGGVILNIASDLALIAPDQRIYRRLDTPEDEQPVKPVTYSVVKAGLLGLTRYLSTYWADKSVRANALLPGGVYQGQDEAFVQRLSGLIPLGRMAGEDEYKAAIVFLLSDASSYMTGAVVSMDGGRTAW